MSSRIPVQAASSPAERAPRRGAALIKKLAIEIVPQRMTIGGRAVCATASTCPAEELAVAAKPRASGLEFLCMLLDNRRHIALANSRPTALAAVKSGRRSSLSLCDGTALPHRRFDGAINERGFTAYVEQILLPTLRPGDIRSHKRKAAQCHRARRCVSCGASATSRRRPMQPRAPRRSRDA
jgi:hypothetical protein